MIMCLDVGNSQIYGGIFADDQILFQFRRNSLGGSSSDEYGLFLRGVLRENGFDPQKVEKIALCTVVPQVVHSLKNCCLKYFEKSPFVLQAGVKTGLKINYRNPLEVGADRIANSIAATHLYPNQNLIVIDLGTATTFCVITASRQYLGGCIMAGLKISMEALENRTSKLPSVELVQPKQVLGRSTVESIQSGLYYGHVGAIQKIVHKLREEALDGAPTQVIGTGGLSSLFENESVFDVIIPDLVLIGLNAALKFNS